MLYRVFETDLIERCLCVPDVIEICILSLKLNPVESQSETCGTSVPLLILKVNRNSSI